MKTFIMISVAASLGFAALILTSFIQYNHKTGPEKNNGEKATGPGFAVVELFTSEGCSSCPPADELVAKVEQANPDKPVYILAFHVDYWDFQGWKDVFSSKDFTKRQYQYAGWLRTETVYTPQIVVNGKKEFVGSDESKLTDAITSGLESSASAKLVLEAKQGQNKLTVQYQTSGASRSTDLQLAVVQKVARTTVKRGENAGRELSHVQIVHQIQSQAVGKTGKGSVEINLPEGFDAKGWEIIGFLQNRNNGEILAAAKPDFKENI